MTDLQNTVAVVTGSTRGIGRSIALTLARRGADVVIHGAHSQQRADEVAAEVIALGRQANVLLCDLQDVGATHDFVETAFRWKNRIDIWVNNAGFDSLTGDAAKLPFESKLEQLWRTDVLGTIYCSRLIGQRMKASQSGQIINIGWDQAWQGMEGESGELFATTKGAVMAFTKSLAKSLAPEVRVNCVAPGWIQTEWGEQHASDYWQQRAVGESLRGRWGTADDVAAAVAFLASPEADFISGHTLPVNGGFRSATHRDEPS